MSPGTVATLRVGAARVRVRVTGPAGPGRVYARSVEPDTFGDVVGSMGWRGYRGKVSIRIARLSPVDFG